MIQVKDAAALSELSWLKAQPTRLLELHFDMLAAYLARPLSDDQIAQALPLLQLIDPTLTHERWYDYARLFFCAAPRGEKHDIITIQNGKGYIYGLAFCRLRMDLRDGRVLEVENFISLDLSGGRRVAAALLDALEARAQAWSCDRICVRPPDPQLRQPVAVAVTRSFPAPVRVPRLSKTEA